jgi:hypothetical protein
MLQPRKWFLPISLGLFALCAVFGARLRAQDAQPSTGHGKALLPSASRVVFGQTVGPSTAMPHWENGYLISRDVETFQAGTPNVRLYDGSGNQAVAASIWFPDAVRVLIYSATATSDGRIIAGASAEKLDGTGVSFIAMTDPVGKVTNVMQTVGFGPLNICLARDGTVWSFGGTGFDEHSHLPKPGNTLRHFDFQKGEVASYLARSLFPNYPRPETTAGIRCSADEVVAYSPNAHVYIQMKYAGAAPEVYHTEEPVGLRFVGFASTGSKQIYGHFSKLGKGGLYYLAFDETSKTAQWLPVTGAAGDLNTPGVITVLWGDDGDKLVVSRAEDPVGASALHWVPVVDR